MKGLDSNIYDIVCVSPRNHMVFTPLLASTCVGTLEFRSVAEPVARIQPAISKEPGSFFFLANCTGINADKHEVSLFFFFLYLNLFVHVYQVFDFFFFFQFHGLYGLVMVREKKGFLEIKFTRFDLNRNGVNCHLGSSIC